MAATDPAQIELLVLDVDGVLTDGRITLSPSGEESKSFHVRDGSGMKYWQRVGRKLAIISGRGSPAVLRRAEELGVAAVRLHCKRKLPAFEEVCRELGVEPGRAAVAGDDLTDLPLIRAAGFSAAPADAVEEVRAAVDCVLTLAGGQGCVRELVEMLLKRAGLWQQVMKRYLPEEGQTR